MNRTIVAMPILPTTGTLSPFEAIDGMGWRATFSTPRGDRLVSLIPTRYDGSVEALVVDAVTDRADADAPDVDDFGGVILPADGVDAYLARVHTWTRSDALRKRATAYRGEAALLLAEAERCERLAVALDLP